MHRQPYHPADLVALNGGIRLIFDIGGMPCIEIKSAGEAFTQLAAGEDVPPQLRRYYARIGQKLTETEAHLSKYLHSIRHEGEDLSGRIHSALGQAKLTEEEMIRLCQVNKRLQNLEKILQQKIDAMHERLEGVNPEGVEWDVWDSVEIVLVLTIGSDAERPAYNPTKWSEDDNMESLEIRVRIWERSRRVVSSVLCGLDDGQNHNDLSGCEGSQMQHFHQCYLFHELWDHAHVGFWGMLNLRSIWIEVKPHRSGNYVI